MLVKGRTKIGGFCIILSTLTLLSACTDEKMTLQEKGRSETPAVNTAAPAANNAKTYKATLSDKLIVDATIDAPDVKEASVLPVEEAIFDSRKLCDTFLGSKDVKQEKNNSPDTSYVLGNKKLIIGQGQYFRFETSLGIYADNVVDDGQDSEASKNTDKFKLNELDFMPKQKAVEKAEDILKALNITPHMPPKVYALDYETLQQEQEMLLKDEGFKSFVDVGKIKLKDKWAKEDECYYMIFKMDFHGIPCDTTHYIIQSNGIIVDGGRIIIIYSKNGIELFNVNGTLYHQKDSKVNASKLISIEQALDSLKEKYASVILKDELKVTGISLIYEPVLINCTINPKTGELSNKQMELVPAWIFNAEQNYSKTGKSYMKYSTVRINAITGKEIQ